MGEDRESGEGRRDGKGCWELVLTAVFQLPGERGRGTRAPVFSDDTTKQSVSNTKPWPTLKRESFVIAPVFNEAEHERAPAGVSIADNVLYFCKTAGDLLSPCFLKSRRI